MIIQLRDDVSDRLIHLTKDNENANSFGTFIKIVRDRALRGGTGHIYRQHRCVCFSEAPISKLGLLLANPTPQVRYKPFGLMFEKTIIYKAGGRPVIYQEKAAYDLLDPAKRHLHVTYNPIEPVDKDDESFADFTWEREWRIETEAFPFTPNQVTLVVPNRVVAETLAKVFQEDNERDPANAASSPWYFIALSDLGLPVNLPNFA